jgi:hypothetical protein
MSIDKKIKYEEVPQLVKKTKGKKRKGYKGGADAATASFGASSGYKGPSGSTGRKGSVNVSSTGNVSFDPGGSDKPAQQVIGGQSYPVTPENRALRDRLFEEQAMDKTIEQKKFIYEPANYPGYIPPALKFLANLNREPNRTFFAQNVLTGKYGTDLLTKSLGLDTDDLSFTAGDLTEEQYEKAYQDYMSDRLAGNIDAYGRKISPTGGGGGSMPIAGGITSMVSGPVQDVVQDAGITATTVAQDPSRQSYYDSLYQQLIQSGINPSSAANIAQYRTNINFA